MEKKFSIEFKQCPLCGCPDTTCRLAYKEEVVDKGKGPDAFASTEKKATPLIDPRKATLTLPVLVESYDNCAKCGFRYCTKSEVVDGKIGGMVPPGRGFGSPQGFPGNS